MTRTFLFRFALSALFATTGLAACSSDATNDVEDVELDTSEAELSTLARSFIGTYEAPANGPMLDFAKLTLEGDGTYKAVVDGALIPILCVRAPCQAPEEGRWSIARLRGGKNRLRVSPKDHARREYTVTLRADEMTLARGGRSGTLVKEIASSCIAMLCEAGTQCVEENGRGRCVPIDPCATVRCASGTRCEVQNDRAVCVPVINRCAAVLCGPGTRCEVQSNGRVACVPTAPPCVVTGCSAHVCADGPRYTTCEFRPAYACYRAHGVCGRDASGACGWRDTPALSTCLANAGN